MYLRASDGLGKGLGGHLAREAVKSYWPDAESDDVNSAENKTSR